MKRKTYFNLGLVAGCMSGAGITGLRQDILGKERYIQSVRDHWVSSSITVPIEIVFLLIAVATTCYAGYQLAFDNFSAKNRQG